MTYLVTDNCIRCKYMDCVAVRPVDCFHEDEHMLVIHPEECIDCGVCEPECLTEAIKGVETWLARNADGCGSAGHHREERSAAGPGGRARRAGQAGEGLRN